MMFKRCVAKILISTVYVNKIKIHPIKGLHVENVH
jgi:hypothetical protein